MTNWRRRMAAILIGDLLLSQMLLVHPVRVLSSNLERWQLVSSLVWRAGWVYCLGLLLGRISLLLRVLRVLVGVCWRSLHMRWSRCGLERYWGQTLIRRGILGRTSTS